MRFTIPLSAITLMVASVKAAENPIIGLVDRITSISQDFDNVLEDPNPVRIIETLPVSIKSLSDDSATCLP